MDRNMNIPGTYRLKVKSLIRRVLSDNKQANKILDYNKKILLLQNQKVQKNMNTVKQSPWRWVY